MVEIAKPFLICAVVLTAASFATAKVTTEWIEQKLDHLNTSDTRTWRMRYITNDQFFMTGGPLMIYVGGPHPITDDLITSGLFFDTAREQTALLIQTEHRYYGESRPVKNLTTENLKYLNVQQALADLAHLIRTLKSSNHTMKDSKVILAGHEYSGSLVTWFKKLYPDLAVGCWASGAPVLAKLDFKEKKEAIGKSIRLLGGDSCYNRIANGINKMEQMIAENSSAELKTTLNICDTFDVNNELDVAVLSHFLYVTFAVSVENHRDNTIQRTCEQLMQGSDDFKGLSDFVVSYFGNTSCTNFDYKREVAAENVTTFGSNSERQWQYQLCNELGWFPTSTSAQQPFGTKVPLSYFTNLCKDLFGDKFTPEYMESQVNKTNQLFGGLNLQVENVYMTYGQLDPWLPLGIQDINKATIIPMESRLSDLDSINYRESKELKAAKEKFQQLVTEWLEFYFENNIKWT